MNKANIWNIHNKKKAFEMNAPKVKIFISYEIYFVYF